MPVSNAIEWAMFGGDCPRCGQVRTTFDIHANIYVEPNWKTYEDLRLRLDWLFERNLLNPGLKALSSCIHEDGNDAAHDVIGIGKAEAEDLGDFSENVLEALHTVPGQIAENQKRREQRRGAPVE